GNVDALSFGCCLIVLEIEKRREREKTEVFYLFNFEMVSKNALFFRQLGPAQGTGAALGRGGDGSRSRLAPSIQGRKTAAQQMRCWFDDDAAVRFQAQLVTLDLQLGGNSYERSRGKTGDGWQLWDRASWAVFDNSIRQAPQ